MQGCAHWGCDREGACVSAAVDPGRRSENACYRKMYVELLRDLARDLQPVRRRADATTQKLADRVARLSTLELKAQLLTEKAERAGDL